MSAISSGLESLLSTHWLFNHG
ncbi:rCG37870, isoform CRA_b, partial [Rattus norvegicus]